MSISVNKKQCKIFDEQGDVWMESDGSGGINDKPCVFRLTLFWYYHRSFAGMYLILYSPE